MNAKYNPLEAARTAHQHLKPALQRVLTLEDVLYVLYLEFQYHEANATGSIEAVVGYILDESLRHGRAYTVEHIAFVLQGEDVYLRRIGLS